MFTDIVLSKRTDGFERVAERLRIKLVYADAHARVESQADLKRLKAKLVYAYAQRKWIEHPRVPFLLGVEHEAYKDSKHYRRSGLSEGDLQVIKDKRKVMVFDFSRMLTKDPVYMGRVMQSIVLYRKYRIRWIIASFAESPYRLRSSQSYLSLLRALGATDAEGKRAVSLLSETLNK